tara:strand:+ start:47026 stop:47199 length:174 start_codon:yes stop_codon:yes gene_type:complete
MGISLTLYPDLDQLVQDLLYLDEIEKDIPESEKMQITIFIVPKSSHEPQKYLWQTII